MGCSSSFPLPPEPRSGSAASTSSSLSDSMRSRLPRAASIHQVLHKMASLDVVKSHISDFVGGGERDDDSDDDEVKGMTRRGKINQYTFGPRLGSGTQAEVRMATDDEGYKWAIKIVVKRSLMRRGRVGKFGTATGQVAREIAIMKKLSHPSVVRLHELMDDPDEDRLFLVMEYVDGGPIMDDALDGQDPLTEEMARHYFRQLLNGLEYLHRHGIVHRDIKPSNLLVTADFRLKIADFGVSILCKPFSEESAKPRARYQSSLDEPLLKGTSSAPAMNKLAMELSSRSSRRGPPVRSNGQRRNSASRKSASFHVRKRSDRDLRLRRGSSNSEEGDIDELELEYLENGCSPGSVGACSTPDSASSIMSAEALKALPPEALRLQVHQMRRESSSGAERTRVDSDSNTTGSGGGPSHEGTPEAKIPLATPVKRTHDDTLHVLSGTAAFFPPEACGRAFGTGETGSGHVISGKAADVWAANVTLYIFLHGRAPFIAETRQDLFDKICNERLEFPPDKTMRPVLPALWKLRVTTNTPRNFRLRVYRTLHGRAISKSAKRMLRRTLAKDPRRRKSAAHKLWKMNWVKTSPMTMRRSGLRGSFKMRSSFKKPSRFFEPIRRDLSIRRMDPIVPTPSEVKAAVTKAVDLSVAVKLISRSKSWANSSRERISQRSLLHTLSASAITEDVAAEAQEAVLAKPEGVRDIAEGVRDIAEPSAPTAASDATNVNDFSVAPDAADGAESAASGAQDVDRPSVEPVREGGVAATQNEFKSNSNGESCPLPSCSLPPLQPSVTLPPPENGEQSVTEGAPVSDSYSVLQPGAEGRRFKRKSMQVRELRPGGGLKAEHERIRHKPSISIDDIADLDVQNRARRAASETAGHKVADKERRQEMTDVPTEHRIARKTEPLARRGSSAEMSEPEECPVRQVQEHDGQAEEEDELLSRTSRPAFNSDTALAPAMECPAAEAEAVEDPPA